MTAGRLVRAHRLVHALLDMAFATSLRPEIVPKVVAVWALIAKVLANALLSMESALCRLRGVYNGDFGFPFYR